MLGFNISIKMFRHRGKNRTAKHNLRIATILAFVAGIVNVTGFLFFKQQATSVTGHFAQFINDVASLEFWDGTIYFLYIISFLLGSFLSSYLIEKYKESKRLNIFAAPTIIESFILLSIAITSNFLHIKFPNVIICLLLFAMGVQNSFVTKISNAVVRTTHLTGLFTDLGIELSQLFFPNSHPNRKRLKGRIKLRLSIISSFFLGGIVGGYLYSGLEFKLNALFLPASILLISLFYDHLRLRVITTTRRYRRFRS